jgi:hypothetical protein
MNDSVELYLENQGLVRAAIDAQACPFFFHNSLFLISRLLNAPGWSLAEVRGGLLLDAGGEWSIVLPTTTDRDAYAEAVLGALRPGRPVLRLPSWLVAREDVRARGVSQPLWPDFVCRTAEMQTMEGRRLKGVRQRLTRLERTGRVSVITLGPEHAEEAVRVARLWHLQRARELGRIYLFRENIWLFEHWAWLATRLTGVLGKGALVDGALVAVNLSCPLSQTCWVCYTERYDRTAPTYCNQLAFRDACRGFDATELPFVNDGPAQVSYEPGVDNLAAFKHRLAAFELEPFQLSTP